MKFKGLDLTINFLSNSNFFGMESFTMLTIRSYNWIHQKMS